MRPQMSIEWLDLRNWGRDYFLNAGEIIYHDTGK